MYTYGHLLSTAAAAAEAASAAGPEWRPLNALLSVSTKLTTAMVKKTIDVINKTSKYTMLQNHFIHSV